MKQFLVFMCSNCRNFTLAPMGQKSRRCSYCGNLINIRKALRAVFDGHDAASNAVREFNAARGGDEFEKAVERSQDRLHALMPSERIEIKKIREQDETPRRYGKRKRLMKLLQKEASKPCSLGKLEEECKKYELEWTWVEKQILKLSNSGQVIFPRPWQVRLVGGLEEDTDSKKSIIDISSEILGILEEKGSIEVIDLQKLFEAKGISQESINSSLDRLMKKGEIFEPNQGTVKLV